MLTARRRLSLRDEMGARLGMVSSTFRDNDVDDGRGEVGMEVVDGDVQGMFDAS